MSIKIGQASLGETGGRNQQPGNQTGRELNISNWYNGRWLGVLRYKSRKKAERAAQTCEAAIKNRNIGYDMDNRNTAYEAARDRKSTRLNSSHTDSSRMPSSA